MTPLKATILIILLLFPGFGEVQTQAKLMLDSLLKVLKTDISDKDKINTYIKIAEQYEATDSLNNAKYANEALKLARKINYPPGEIDALYSIAWGNLRMGHHQAAKPLFEKGLKRAQSSKDEKRASLGLNKLGLIYERLGNYQKALDYQYAALKIEKKLRNEYNTGRIYNDIGNIYIVQKNYPQALEYYLKSMQIKERRQDQAGLASTYSNIGIIYEEQNQPSLALEYYQRALKIRQAQGDIFGLGASYNNLAMLYKSQKNYEEALEYSFEALKIFEEMGINAYVSYPIITIGEIYMAQAEWQKAKTYLDKGLRLSLETKNTENIRNAAECLAQTEKKLGNYKAAYEHHVLFKQMADSLKNEEKIRETTRIEMSYKFQQEKDSIQFANKTEKIALRKDIEQRKTLQTTTSISLLLLGLLLLTLFFFLRSKIKSNRLLKETSEELLLKSEEITQQAEEIKVLNQVLENNLDNATQDILHKNQKLAEYAFINSHETRAPIARILGLIAVLDTNHVDAETSFILENIHKSVSELDEITTKMNNILNEGGILDANANDK